MSRSYPANTQIQKFLEESYNKERDTRLGWYFKNVQNSDQSRTSKQFEVFKKKIEAACPKPTEDLLKLRKLKAKNYHKRKINVEDNLMKMMEKNGRLAALPKADMVAPPERAKTMLYDGFTKEGKGRYQYLQERYQTIPETKYHFPVLSSWEIGWRLGDVIRTEDIRKPANGRTRIVADTFYTRTGIPDLHCETTF